MRIDPSLISPALTLLYRAWVRSLRFEDGGQFYRIRDAVDSGRPVMLAIWHSELFALTGYGMLHLNGRLATVVSDSRDGEIIAQVLTRIGYGTARGSSTRGGLKALIALKRHIDQGRVGVITVDGPRGPRHKVKEGAVYLAHKTGALLFPVRSRPACKHVFKRSWDRFELPMPFARCPVYFGQPLEFLDEKADADMLAAGCRRLEQALAEALPGE
ncbi:MAG: lysophospholipid acyltransferase family protein [Desulfovibrio sp.]|nr:lysophospholipid acyltransferase family protein [Desulfovibrio sp.]